MLSRRQGLGAQLTAARLATLRERSDTAWSGLAEPQGDRSPAAFAQAPVARVVRYMRVEAFHQSAEICLLRDLYSTSPGWRYESLPT